MPGLHSSQLDAYVRAVHAAGGDLDHPDVARRFLPLELRFDTVIDQSLDPFSEAYVDRQLALYREIAGRELDQGSGELHPIDIGPRLVAANPCGSRDAGRMAEQVRVLSTMLSLAGLGEAPRVLDMGAGEGLSSEVFAAAGARVHAVDIDPLLGRLARERAARLGLDIVRSELNFDDAGSLDSGYRAAFFHQSLHHCLRPWALIETLAGKLDADGVIGFTGEPIQTHWWRHWGLRLDHESLYVARALGWFESGWSHDFIARCFARAGFTLLFFAGGLDGGEIGIAAREPATLSAIRERTRQAGLAERRQDALVFDHGYRSALGVADMLCGRPAFRQGRPGPGALLFGPYARLDAGTYEVSLLLQHDSGRGRLTLDVAADAGRTVLARRSARAGRTPSLQVWTVRLDAPIDRLEIRAHVRDGVGWTVSLPLIRRL